MFKKMCVKCSRDFECPDNRRKQCFGCRAAKGHREVKICPGCSSTFETKDRRRKYCTRSCSTSTSNKLSPKRTARPIIVCPGCNEEFGMARSNQVYCTLTCKQDHRVFLWVSGELDGNGKYTIRPFVRKFVLERAEFRCEGVDDRVQSRCTETRVLQVDHISGDWTDSSPQNLRALCPTCHTLTETYGAKNKGNGRAWKASYNQFSLKVDTEGEDE